MKKKKLKEKNFAGTDIPVSNTTSAKRVNKPLQCVQFLFISQMSLSPLVQFYVKRISKKKEKMITLHQVHRNNNVKNVYQKNKKSWKIASC